MNPKQREQINMEQINRFFASYYSEWRHIKILSNIKILETKYEFYSNILDEIKPTDKTVGEKTIAQEITNGLRFDSIQQSIQYIEDLFALIYASKNKDFFIRNIISYDAGKVGNSIKNFKLSRENICKSFNFPNFQAEDNLNQSELDTLNVLHESVDRLIEMVKELMEFYNKNLFFYNQYKHGLSIALRPFNDYSKEQIEKDKLNENEEGVLVALDSLNFKGAVQRKDGNFGTLLIPNLTDTIQRNIKPLQDENNLLRFVFSAPDLSIDKIKDIAFKTKRCMHIFINNILEVVSQKEKVKLQMPANDKNEVYAFDIKFDEVNLK